MTALVYILWQLRSRPQPLTIVLREPGDRTPRVDQAWSLEQASQMLPDALGRFSLTTEFVTQLCEQAPTDNGWEAFGQHAVVTLRAWLDERVPWTTGPMDDVFQSIAEVDGAAAFGPIRGYLTNC